MANTQDPYSGLLPDNYNQTMAPTFTVGETPEYQKAQQAQQNQQQTQQPVPPAQPLTPYVPPTYASAPSTGANPWTLDPGYKSLAPAQQAEFNSLMTQMESAYQPAYTSWLSGNRATAFDPFALPGFSTPFSALQNKYSGLMPVSAERDPNTGAMSLYQSLLGQYDYLQPNEYAKMASATGMSGDTYLWRNPEQNSSIFYSSEAPSGFHDVGQREFYKMFNIPDPTLMTPEMQAQAAPWMQQVQTLQQQIQDLQNMRPEERAAKEDETGQTLTSYLSNLQDVQKQIGESLSGSGISGPQFNPVTGQKITPEITNFQNYQSQQRELADMLAMPYMTQPTVEQQLNSLALDILLQLIGGRMRQY